ncbi:MAG: hypothetical protein QM622_05935 [Microbacterium sp.]
MSATPFDARALAEPADRAVVRAHIRQLQRSGRAPSFRPSTIAIAVASVLAVIFLGTFASVFGRVVTAMAAVSGAVGFRVVLVIPLVFLALMIVGFGFVIWSAIRRVRGTAERWYRLDRFAQANGMTWHPIAPDPPLPGMVFAQGRSRKSTDVVRGAHPRFVEFGNYEYTTRSGENETTHRWGYVAVKLSTPLPHIVLDATSNNTPFRSNLPASFDKSQRLSLEGDFDKHFTLYCPRGYEADALYLFTPDIMERFIDHAAELDVEIVDDWLFLYAQRQVVTLDPATWAWLFSVVGALLDKFAQWERWRDERLTASAVPPAGPTDSAALAASLPPPSAALPFRAPTAALRPPPGVAAPGRRLVRTIPWRTILIFGGVSLLMMLTHFGAFGAIFNRLFG